MVQRAAIVLLVVLNLGAAAWWCLHAPVPAPAPPEAPAGAARLQLLSESPLAAQPARAVVGAGAAQDDALADESRVDASLPAPAPQETVAPAPAPSTDAGADAASVADAANIAAALACEDADGPAAGWRVWLPKLPSVGAAQTTAARIAEAGFSDYLVVRDGADAGSIALGRYGTEQAARRRTAALRAAGFAARCARIPAATPA